MTASRPGRDLAVSYVDSAEVAVRHSRVILAGNQDAIAIQKGVVAGELPVSLSPSKERRYRITDSYLRFWLAFLGPHLAEVDRMPQT